jgi:hypothetical protein
MIIDDRRKTVNEIMHIISQLVLAC